MLNNDNNNNHPNTNKNINKPDAVHWIETSPASGRYNINMQPTNNKHDNKHTTQHNKSHNDTVSSMGNLHNIHNYITSNVFFIIVKQPKVATGAVERSLHATHDSRRRSFVR